MMNVPSRKRALLPLAGLAGVAVVIAGCTDGGTGGAGGENGGGPGVEFGAPIDAWQAAFDEAFAEIDDVELVWNTSNSATDPTGMGVQAIADKVEEYSNGHVSVEVSFVDSVAPITETFQALQDGRLDVSNVGTFLRPEEFPIMGVFGHEVATTRGPSVIADSLSSIAAFQETYWDTPEVIAEFRDKGLAVFNPQSVAAQNVLFCTQPWTSLAELEGKQIRVASQIQARQVQALGGVPVTVTVTDLYESLQRGIVDCLVYGPVGLQQFPGIGELAPYLMNPQSATFGINTNSYLANGERWATWPLVLQQLLFDVHAEDEVASQAGRPAAYQFVLELVEGEGGGFLGFDQDVEDALKAVNDEAVAAWSDFPLLDGDDFRERLFANLEKWEGLVEEAGYSDAPFSDTEAWLAPGFDIAAFAELYYENVTIPNRPS